MHRLDLGASDASSELEHILRDERIDAVVNLAGSKDRASAATEPLRHIDEQLRIASSVLVAMRAAGIQRLVHASTAAVYAAADVPLAETSPVGPTGPYGHAALAAERLVQAECEAAGLSAIVLRHFLVLGAAHPVLIDASAQTIVSMAFADLAAGRAPRIHGSDYSTFDGTCVRDVVHVVDVAEVHVLALEMLTQRADGFHVYNVGTGVGTSVRSLVEGVRARFPDAPAAVVLPRRAHDIEVVVADIARVSRDLDWRPRLTVDDMLDSAVGAVLASGQKGSRDDGSHHGRSR